MEIFSEIFVGLLLEEVPYSFPMSSVKFLGHGRQQNANFDPICVLPDCKSKLNALMTVK